MNLLQEVHNGNIGRIRDIINQKGLPIDSEWSDYIILRYALWRGHRDIAKLLIEKGCRINKDSKSSSNTPLHIAIKQEDVEIVDILLSKGALIEAKNHVGDTPLHFAAKVKNNAIIDLLLDRTNSSGPNFIEKGELSSLHIACMRDDVAAVKNLLESKSTLINEPVSLSSPFWPTYTPLHFAVEFDKTEIVKLLLKHGANVCAKCKKGLTPLHLAVNRNSKFIIDLILKAHGKDSKSINPVDGSGFSHFHAACMRNNPKVVHGFLKRGVEINNAVDLTSSQWPGWTPLHFAADYECIETVKLLLQYGADMSIKNGKNLTALHTAIQGNNKEIIDVILSAHVTNSKESNPVDDRGFSHFHAACMRDDPSIVEIFLKNGVDVNTRINLDSPDWANYTPLHFAVENKCLATVKLLLRYQADINAKDVKMGFTPLHLATVHFREEIVRELLCHGADINNKSRTGTTPLHIAASNATEKESASLVKILISFHADVNCTELLKFSTPLHLATLHKNYEIIELLLKNGANVNAKERDGKTPLHTMALRDPRKELDMELVESYRKIITALVDAGCDINLQDAYGRTPLHMSSLYRNLAGAFALLQHGADINIEDSHGKSPLSYCMHVFHNIYYIFQDHIEKLKVIKFPISEKNDVCYVKLKSSYKKFKRKWKDVDNEEEFQQRCEDELANMKKVRLDTYSSLFDIIYKNPNEMTSRVKNNTLREIVTSSDFDKLFPLYGYLIKLNFKGGLIREKLIKPSKDSLESLVGIKLPDICAEMILKMLTNESLKELIKVKSN
ncbi:hypothetical protein QAD02_006953 [Eretmocerus hayati]|uniref:Uncharacterized protein n=1 Tax=Eretmocerus hayati TaxID=131215 RepID=A0ACC2N3I4_9HYME|nr:hypothetical protein QAD02_006953 [Eretmocerus hayati]